MNQYTPDGSVEWTTDPNQSQSFTDPANGATYEIPRYNQTVTLSPEQQAIKAQTDAATLNLATAGNSQTQRLSETLGKPVDLSNDAVEGRLFDLGRKRLDPMFSERQQQLDARLANQGIGIGSKAYESAQRAQSEQENDAYNQIILSGRGQSIQEILAGRNQIINESSALASGSQVSQPNFLGTNQPTLPTVDQAGLINENYNQRLGIAQQKNAATQSVFGGLFGLGSALIRSDRRMKENIKPIGKADNGLPIYMFNYIGDDDLQVGFMADEVRELHPDAVVEDEDGFLMVDYAKAVL